MLSAYALLILTILLTFTIKLVVLTLYSHARPHTRTHIHTHIHSKYVLILQLISEKLFLRLGVRRLRRLLHRRHRL